MTDWLIPLLALSILVMAAWKHLPMYDLFVQGAAEGIHTAVRVLPNLAAMLCAISLMQASGIMDALCGFCMPVLAWIGIPAEVAPLVFIRPLSGSGALAMLEEILERCGADSRAGLIASTVMGAGETIFYTAGIYMSVAGGRKTTYAIPCSLLGAFASVWLAGMLF